MEQNLFWLALLAYALGAKHGMDADHLATIDGFVRGNAARRPRLARYSGMLFSLGHGAVVICVATTAAAMSGAWKLPGWLEDTGALVSIFFLALLGAYNLRQVLQPATGGVVHPVGLKSRLLPAFGAAGPWAIAAVGVLFALSFDTLSQALLFSIAVTGSHGAAGALLLGILFMLGMMTTDALNGMWTAWLVRRADRTAEIASRVMGGAVAVLSLGVAAFGLGKYLMPAFAEQADAWGLWTGAAVLAFVLLAYLVAVRLSGLRASPRIAEAAAE